MTRAHSMVGVAYGVWREGQIFTAGQSPLNLLKGAHALHWIC